MEANEAGKDGCSVRPVLKDGEWRKSEWADAFAYGLPAATKARRVIRGYSRAATDTRGGREAWSQ